MRRAQGYAVTTKPGGQAVEEDTSTCSHCNCIIFQKPGVNADLGGFCRLCYSHICGPCADRGTCDPFERKMERIESRDRLVRACRG